MADQAMQQATDELNDWIKLRGRDLFRLDRAVAVAVQAFVAERFSNAPELHEEWCSYRIHDDCCTGLARCDCRIAERILEGTSE